MECWNVFLGSKRVDCVWTVPGMTAEDVKRSLVEHDGYNPGITVRRAK